MKKITIILSLLFFAGNLHDGNTQVLKRVTKRVARSAEKAVTKKVEKKTTEETNKAMDSVLGNKKSERKDRKTKSDKGNGEVLASTDRKSADSTETTGPWMSYDFIPGKNVIFYDTMNDEDYGDFPRRWDLLEGSAEVGRFGKGKTMLFYHPRTAIKPLFKEENYLPKTFSIEFDIYFDDFAHKRGSKYEIYFNKDSYNPVKIDSWFPFQAAYKKIKYTTSDYDQIPNFIGWHHIAMSYNNGNLKVYFDEQKVLNIPHWDIVPTQINKIKIGYTTKKGMQRTLSIKNFKIAEGGGKPYDQIISDGKFVTNGILFDSGKAVLKPQSSGVIKRVVDMLIDNPEWKFKIVGHTDSDGEEDTNLALSQKRAEAVKIAITRRGITEDRLSILGKGESEPLNENGTIEEKANNRRVEFVLNK